jgi:hypothetical protein
VQRRRRCVRCTRRAAKEHDVPFHHNLDHFLDEYIAAAGISGDANGSRLSVSNDNAQVRHSLRFGTVARAGKSRAPASASPTRSATSLPPGHRCGKRLEKAAKAQRGHDSRECFLIKGFQARTAEIRQPDFALGFRVDRRAESLSAPLPP